MWKIALLIFFQCTCITLLSQKNFLIKNGKSDYYINIVLDAEGEVAYSKDKLIKYLKEATECELPVLNQKNQRPSITMSVDSFMAPQSFQILCNNRNIFIKGGINRGIIYGTYFFLHEVIELTFLGKGEYYITKSKDVEFSSKVDKKLSSAFQNRFIYSLEGYDDEYVDANMLQIPFAKHYNIAHTFQTDMLPPDSFFSTHPEYYALKNGKRVIQQPNLSNPDLVKIVVENIKHKIATSKPGKYTTFSVSLDDNTLIDDDNTSSKITQKEGGYMGVLLSFVNKIADFFPNYNISTLAYQQTKKLPNTIRPRSNVVILLTNADTDKSKTIEEDGFDVNQQVNIKKLIHDWVTTNTQLIFWDYVSNYTNPFMPWPILYTIKPNISYLQKKGIKEIFLQQAGIYYKPDSPIMSYLISRLLIDPSLKSETIINEFCKKYYGPSAKFLIQYYTEINLKAFKGKDKMYTYDSASKFRNTLFSYNDVNRWRLLLERAINLKESNDVYRKRIMLQKLSLDYVYLQLSTLYPNWNLHRKSADIFKESNDFVKNCAFANVTKLSPDGYKPSDFNGEVKKALNKN